MKECGQRTAAKPATQSRIVVLPCGCVARCTLGWPTTVPSHTGGLAMPPLQLSTAAVAAAAAAFAAAAPQAAS